MGERNWQPIAHTIYPDDWEVVPYTTYVLKYLYTTSLQKDDYLRLCSGYDRRIIETRKLLLKCAPYPCKTNVFEESYDTRRRAPRYIGIHRATPVYGISLLNIGKKKKNDARVFSIRPLFNDRNRMVVNHPYTNDTLDSDNLKPTRKRYAASGLLSFRGHAQC